MSIVTAAYLLANVAYMTVLTPAEILESEAVAVVCSPIHSHPQIYNVIPIIHYITMEQSASIRNNAVQTVIFF